MNNLSFSDLAYTFSNTRLTSQVKDDLEKYNYEVSSGRKSDLRSAVSGDFGPLASIERSIRSLGAYKTTLGEAEFFTSSLQSALAHVADHVSSVASDLIVASGTNDAGVRHIAALDTQQRLDSVVSALNARAGGKALLSGAASDTSAIAPTAEWLPAVATAVSSETTVDGVMDALDLWFDAPSGGFETLAYRGSDAPAAPFVLNDRERLDMELKADDATIRDVLKGFVVASLVSDGLFDGDDAAQSQLLRRSGEILMSSEAKLSEVRGDIGVIEERIETAKMSNVAEAYAMEMAKNEIISSDVYESASKLNQTQTQLEMIYTITARLSRLKLSDFL